MDLNVIIQAISSVGFPIAMCVMLLWYVKDQGDRHKEESEKFTEALNRNTLVLQKLCDKMEVKNESIIDRT